jgi:hypothetical protein
MLYSDPLMSELLDVTLGHPDEPEVPAEQAPFLVEPPLEQPKPEPSDLLDILPRYGIKGIQWTARYCYRSRALGWGVLLVLLEGL